MSGISSSNLRAIANAVPDALRPEWMRATWGGSFGSSHLRANMDDISSFLTLQPAGLSASAGADGVVYGVRGGNVGEISRTVRLAQDGALTVSHDYLELNARAQGTGFARELNDRAFARYAEAGVDRVEVHAALTMGGYAWARQGFELVSNEAPGFATDLARSQQLRTFVEAARRANSIDDAQFAALMARLPVGRDLPPDALVSVQQLAALDVGRSVLAGRSWDGARPIAKTADWWSAAQQPAAGAAGATDAMRGAASLTGPQQAARTLGERLPPALDPVRARDAFAASFTHHLDDAHLDRSKAPSTTMSLVDGDEVGSIEAVLPLRFGKSKTAQVRAAWSPSRNEVVGSEHLPTAARVAPVRAALDDAWRGLGVRKVTDASAGVSRLLD